MKCKGHDFIKKSRDYLDYLEEHLTNIEKAFEIVCEKFKHSHLIYDDVHFFNIKGMVEFHDLSKFSENEFTQYRSKFYPTEMEKNNPILIDTIKTKFDLAWSNHESENNHHAKFIKSMNPAHYGNSQYDLYCIVHMAIDLIAMAIKFKDNPHQYYLKNINEFGLNQYHHDLLTEIFEACGYHK